MEKRPTSKGTNRTTTKTQPAVERQVQVQTWAAQGASGREIAERLGISYGQFNQALEESPELREAHSAGIDQADDRIESALFERATGFEYYSEEQFKEELVHQGKNTGDVKVKEVKKKIKVLGEISAQIFWLKNRRPDKWRDKQELKPPEKAQGGIVYLPQVASSSEDWSNLVIEHEKQQVHELTT